VVLREIDYQTIMYGFNATLIKEKCKAFIPYNMYIGYGLTSSQFSKKEYISLLEYKFPQGKFRRHHPKGLVSEHEKQLNIVWPYIHGQWDHERHL
jgi:hypothetical protein